MNNLLRWIIDNILIIKITNMDMEYEMWTWIWNMDVEHEIWNMDRTENNEILSFFHFCIFRNIKECIEILLSFQVFDTIEANKPNHYHIVLKWLG